MAVAVPLFAAARSVLVMTVGEQHQASATSTVDYLAWHRITAEHRRISLIAGVGRQEQLLAAARDEGADLLVMGGYGHTPWREMLLGGATRGVVWTSLLPVLLSH